ncbi:(2Fe-2S)-binding protein [Salsuginibacillus kocurii]|uniref:(2Fe-2S)-binding protein n=1 Tax=Salsuginibacillus kocurii TaxID=427078 RepID=UPI00035CD28A|nr:(2Fe-2S)-binding protein [Salsuginibacillus kocurii]
MAVNKQSVTVQEPGSVPGERTLSFSVNGRWQKVNATPTTRLVTILREELQLTGTKISCEIGRCGACSVWMDGELINSCLTLAYQVEGREITTIEGVGTLDKLDPVQEAFLQEGGFQCGYCTPGMIMAVKALVKERPDPSEEEVEEALAGNLCRCTGYTGIHRAVQRVVKDLS